MVTARTGIRAQACSGWRGLVVAGLLSGSLIGVAPASAGAGVALPCAVTSNLDAPSGGTLREMVADPSCGEINLNIPASSGDAILLMLGELSVDRDLTINGPGANLLILNGNNNSRVQPRQRRECHAERLHDQQQHQCSQRWRCDHQPGQLNAERDGPRQ